MKPRSHEPIFWSLFGGGGMLAALVGPILVLIVGLLVPMGMGFGSDAMGYEQMRALLGHPLVGFGLAILIALFFFHAAHRILHTLHDLGVHATPRLKQICYGSAVGGSTLAVLVALVLVVRA